MSRKANCDDCINYMYDEELEYYTCAMDLDEDEMRRFVLGEFRECPYYRPGDDYTIVRHQN